MKFVNNSDNRMFVIMHSYNNITDDICIVYKCKCLCENYNLFYFMDPVMVCD